MPARVLLQDFTGVPAVVDLAAMRDAMKKLGRRRQADQPAAAGRAGHRSLGAGRRVRHAGGAVAERADRVLAQQGALRLPALGPVGVPQLRGRAARHRHRPPGEPRVPGARGLHATTTTRTAPAAGLPRHGRRHRLAHDDGQRPRRARLGRGRHRGRGGDAGPADVDADPAGGRLPAARQAARGLDGDRSGPDRHRDAAQEGRGRQVRRVLRPRRGGAVARRPRDHRQHGARVRRDLRHLPDRRRDAALPAFLGPRRRADRARRGLRARAGAVPRRDDQGGGVLRRGRPRSRRRRAERRRARSARRIASACTGRRSRSRRRCRRWSSRRRRRASVSASAPGEASQSTNVGYAPARRRRPRSRTARWSSPPSPAAPTPRTRR